MGQVAHSALSRTAAVENSDFLGPWNHVTGEGRTPVERAADKPALVAAALLAALNQDVAWQARVQEVREGAEPRVVAKSYGLGSRRRRCIASLLVICSTRLGLAFAYTVPSETSDARRANRYSRLFWEKVEHGITCLVCLGAERCMTCAAPLDTPRREDPARENRTMRDPYCAGCTPDDHIDRHAIEFVFDQLELTLPPLAEPRVASNPIPPRVPEPIGQSLPDDELADALGAVEEAGARNAWPLEMRQRWLGLRAELHRRGVLGDD